MDARNAQLFVCPAPIENEARRAAPRPILVWVVLHPKAAATTDRERAFFFWGRGESEEGEARAAALQGNEYPGARAAAKRPRENRREENALDHVSRRCYVLAAAAWGQAAGELRARSGLVPNRK